MFIKKDLRKIPEILRDAAAAASAVNHDDDNLGGSVGGAAAAAAASSAAASPAAVVLTSLHLARRKDEFPDGRVRCLTEPSTPHAKALLRHVQSLSLYDCEISDITGLGPALTDLRDLCLGRNPLATLPDDLANLSNLQRLWLDDCRLEALPNCVLELSNLQELRVSHNLLTALPENLHELVELKVLCVDHNQLESLPTRLPPFLTTLQIRENKLTSLPALPPTLKLLQASSNRITTVGEATSSTPDIMDGIMDVTHVYLNDNQLTEVPQVFLKGCQLLKRLNLSHNRIAELTDDFLNLHGPPDVHGMCSDNVAWLVHNPVVELLHSNPNGVKGAPPSDASADNDIRMDVDDEPAGADTGATHEAAAAAPPAVLA